MKDHKDEKEIIVNPENWDDMKKKYEEREAQAIQKVMEQRNVTTMAELQDVAKQALVTRSTRGSSEHQTIKDHKILAEPKSEEIKSLRQELNEEIKRVAKTMLQQLPTLGTTPQALKGRITIGAPSEAVEA